MSKSIFLVFNLLQQDIFIYPSKTSTQVHFNSNVKAFQTKRKGI